MQGAGTGPVVSCGLQGPDPVSSCHPKTPRPRRHAWAVRVPAVAVGSGLAPCCRCHDSVQKALCLAVLARSNQRHGQAGCGLGGSQLPASDGSCFQTPREPQTPSHSDSEALAGSPGLMQGGRSPQSPRPAPLITRGWGASRERAR